MSARCVRELADASGNSLPTVTHQFIPDDAGDRIPLSVDIGRALGPSLYLRLGEIFDRRTSPSMIGGLTFDL